MTGTPLRSWRSGGLSLRPLHDAARRPIGLLVDEGAGERLVSLSIFGDAVSDLPSTNHALGRPVHIYDTAGRVTLTYDLKGRVTAQTRTLLADITTEADWSGLESESSLADIATWLSTDASLSTDTADTFAVSTAYDALDRVTEQTAPDSSRTVPTYDEGGRLSQVEVYVRGDSTATEIVSSITSNARGQREQIVYGNHTQTSYTYDPERLWLTNLTTTRSSASSHGAATLQDLGFTRDAVGNITEITDDAQETVYFANSQVSPTRTFTYDALYRLVSARGREKDAQTQSTAFYADYAGAMGTIPQSGSGVLRRYTQSYEYDAAGNILEVKHQQGDAGTVLWRRGYAYETDNNQLLSTSLPGDDPDDPGTHSQTYAMNDRGAIVYLPHLKTGVSTNLVRDFRDQLRKAELDNAGNVSWYAYDAVGERVWKVWDKGSVVEERIYLGGYEVWRKRNGSGVLQEERQTLHVMDDQRRVAMIETLTVTGGSAVSTPTPRFRYQLDDQLGSALLEVDDDGGVISYEEYHPYGTTAWWAEDAAIEVSRKRYRYTGKERDEETGLQYHSARYYAPWLGRWDRPDPIGLGDGGNRWGYVSGSPMDRHDPDGMAKEKFPLNPPAPETYDPKYKMLAPEEILSRQAEVRQAAEGAKESAPIAASHMLRWIDNDGSTVDVPRSEVDWSNPDAGFQREALGKVRPEFAAGIEKRLDPSHGETLATGQTVTLRWHDAGRAWPVIQHTLTPTARLEQDLSIAYGGYTYLIEADVRALLDEATGSITEVEVLEIRFQIVDRMDFRPGEKARVPLLPGMNPPIPPSAGYVTSFGPIGSYAVTNDDWFVELEASGGATSFGLRSELFVVSGDWMGGNYAVTDGKKVSP